MTLTFSLTGFCFPGPKRFSVAMWSARPPRRRRVVCVSAPLQLRGPCVRPAAGCTACIPSIIYFHSFKHPIQWTIQFFFLSSHHRPPGATVSILVCVSSTWQTFLWWNLGTQMSHSDSLNSHSLAQLVRVSIAPDPLSLPDLNPAASLGTQHPVSRCLPLITGQCLCGCYHSCFLICKILVYLLPIFLLNYLSFSYCFVGVL